MNLISIGDLSLGLQLRSANASLKKHLNVLTAEVTSGERQDRGAALGGNFQPLAGIERQLQTAEPRKRAAVEADLAATGLQAALAKIDERLSGKGMAFQQWSQSGNSAEVDRNGLEARDMLNDVIDALNVNISGRYLLSGTDSGTKPLIEPDQLLTQLKAVIVGQPTALDMRNAIVAWFDTPRGGGGFIDMAYSGNDAPLSLGFDSGQTGSIGLTAADQDMRNILSAVATAALLSDPSVGTSDSIRAGLLNLSGAAILQSESDLTELRAGVGRLEERLDRDSTQREAEITALEIARSGLIGADPYDSASRLEAVSTQLEILHEVTARLSQLSLAKYL